MPIYYPIPDISLHVARHWHEKTQIWENTKVCNGFLSHLSLLGNAKVKEWKVFTDLLYLCEIWNWYVFFLIVMISYQYC